MIQFYVSQQGIFVPCFPLADVADEWELIEMNSIEVLRHEYAPSTSVDREYQEPDVAAVDVEETWEVNWTASRISGCGRDEMKRYGITL